VVVSLNFYFVSFTYMSSFKIISVTGAHSGVGKTSLCSILLNNLKGFGAIKFTRTELYSSVIDDPEIIAEKNKDTAVLSESGAERVVWIKSPADELEHALDMAIGKMVGLCGVVIEGNSPLGFLNPDLIIFVIGSDGEIKPTALKVSENADMIVFNADNSISYPPSVLNLLHNNVNLFRMDVKEKTGEIDKFISHVKKYIK
jgi:molybdopterin-guanine dinucleotide biosynthesis protein